jgi:hypothetical protein
MFSAYQSEWKINCNVYHKKYIAKFNSRFLRGGSVKQHNAFLKKKEKEKEKERKEMEKKKINDFWMEKNGKFPNKDQEWCICDFDLKIL